MGGSTKLRMMVTGLFMAVLAGTVHAGGAALDIAAPANAGASGDLHSYMLAANDTVATPDKVNASAGTTPVATREVKDPWFTANKVHEYLGLGTILLAAATAATAPEGCETNCANYQPPTNGTHAKLGRATRAMALSAVATGIAFHWDDIHLFEDGLKDPDTQHWLLAGTGALLLANAVGRAPAHSHSTQAELGALMMLAAIKITW
jgi:hypothetical protein